jgi:hypothetical protein
MKPSLRKLKKWRKESPKKHRSYAEKRNRLSKLNKKEIEESAQ